MAAKRKKPTEEKTETVYKCVRPTGCDFRTGTVNYADALASGVAVEILDADPPNGSVCGHGIHVSPTARKTIQFAERHIRPWRWFEGTVAVADIVERDQQKLRVKRFKPTKEIFLADIFGNDLAERVEATRMAIDSWKSIPWLKPASTVPDEAIFELVNQWREALMPWMKNGKTLPDKIRIVKTDDAADADAAAADAAAAAAAAAADADAAAAAAADADADVNFSTRIRWYLRWYVRPRYVLRRSAWWHIADMPGASPWEPFVEIFKLGCLPIGFVKGEFVVFVPDAVQSKPKRKAKSSKRKESAM